MARLVPYRTFNEVPIERQPWLGRRLAFLTLRSDLDPAVMERILDALDRAADFYARVTGREPEPSHQHEGRTTIAEVPGIGGAAWAWLGKTGIEIQPEYFEVLYTAARDRGELDQPLFYELGRNYWFYEKQLDLHPGSVATGFAVYMRFLSMDAAGVRGAPYRGWPFAEFRATVESMLDVFAEKREPSWEALFSEPPVHVHTFEQPGRESLGLSTADLIASLLNRLASENGGGEVFMTRFLAAAAKFDLPGRFAPKSRERGLAICANIFHAACRAAGPRDLRENFRAWRWPDLDRLVV